MTTPGKRVRLLNEYFYWHRPNMRTKMHAYPGTHPGETHFWTFCGLYVETGILNIEREASEEEICLTCLAALRREHAGDIEEVE